MYKLVSPESTDTEGTSRRSVIGAGAFAGCGLLEGCLYQNRSDIAEQRDTAQPGDDNRVLIVFFFAHGKHTGCS